MAESLFQCIAVRGFVTQMWLNDNTDVKSREWMP
jgi:hypothetical protein